MNTVRVLALASVCTISIGAVVLFSPPAGSQTGAAGTPSDLVDAGGNMRIPDNYRTGYEYLGSWAVAGEDRGSKQIHTVYASPGAVAAYKRDGRFPDGTVLVKEVFDAATGIMTTGTASHEDKLEGWFMMVKDGKNSHPDSKLWGNGWGWSWFDAPTPTKAKTVSFRAECLGCHVPAQATDWIYVQGYPGLKK